MVCPKCGYNGADGLECARCGVIFDKYRVGGTGPGSLPNQMPMGNSRPIPRLAPSRAGRDDRPRRPLALTLFRYFVLIVVLVGCGGLLDYMRLHMLGNQMMTVIKQTLDVRRYKGRPLNAENVMLLMRVQAKEQNYELPEERVWMRIKGRAGDHGGVVEIDLRMHMPQKLMGFIKFDIIREMRVGVPARWPTAMAEYETPPTEEVSKDLIAAGNLGAPAP